ncbi:hypothetical protein T310_8781, partial [Rasamsonia emersonii CBS 393.64]
QESGLGHVEASPQTVFQHVATRWHLVRTDSTFTNPLRMRWRYLLLRRSVHRPVHRTNTGNQAQSDNSPWVRSHQTEGPSVGVQRPSGNGDNTNSKPSVQERLVQIFSLIRRHSTILAGLAVEDQVRSQHRSAHDGGSVQDLLAQVACLGHLVGLLHVRAAESILEGLSGSAEDQGR